MEQSKLYIDALQRGGYRITEQRRAVCDFLGRTQLHPTPSQVYDSVSRLHPEISRATVYNTLNALRDLGAIVEISVGGDHTHYDTDPTPHVNLICLRCDDVFDYSGDMSIEGLHRSIFEETDFQPVATQIQMVGFCAACRKKKRAEIWEQLNG